MSNFVDNNTALPATKTDLVPPPSGAAQNYFDAADCNTIEQATYDLRTVQNRQVSIMSFGADPTGTLSCNAAFSAALTAMGNSGTLHLPPQGPNASSVFLLSSSLNIPAGVALAFDGNAQLSIALSATLTINGSIVAPTDAQIFTFPSGNTQPVSIYSNGPVSVRWFGAVGDNVHDDTVAIQACCNALVDQEVSTTFATIGYKGQLRFSAGKYKTSAAIALPNFCDVVGENAVILGSITTNDIFHLQYQGNISGIQFVGGAKAISFQNSDIADNFYTVDRCGFYDQNSAAIFSYDTAAAIQAAISRCIFVGSVSAANILVAACDLISVNDCTMTADGISGAAVLLKWGRLRVKNLLGIPAVAQAEWVLVGSTTVTGNTTILELEECRFGGESGGATIVNWGMPPGNSEDTALYIRNSSLFSTNNPLVVLTTMPNYVEILGNTSYGFFTSTPGIQLNTAIVSLDNYEAYTYKWKIQPDIPMAPGSGPLTDQILGNRGDDLNKENAGVLQSQLVATGLPSGLAKVQSLVNCTFATTGGTANDFGQDTALLAATGAAANGAVNWTNILNGLGAGMYTAVFELNLSDPASVAFTAAFCASALAHYNLHSGKHIISLPFSISSAVAGATAWQAAHTGYTLGTCVYANYSVDNRVPVLQAVVVPASAESGASLAAMSPAPNNTLGQLFSDGTGATAITWQCIGSLDIDLFWLPVTSTATMSIGRVRIFSGVVNINTSNSVLLGTTYPTGGSYGQVGDVVTNVAPAHSGSMGWVCTASASPGTWYAFGAIS